MLSHPRSRLRHISLCHSYCIASLAPSACALAKRRQPLVVRRNRVKFYVYSNTFDNLFLFSIVRQFVR
ncbi:hypothetical protein EHQ82_05225 [Leptospira selangorensis]|nr:hypothetical protein EHQ82_05225 [Leptospira selangorensis]